MIRIFMLTPLHENVECEQRAPNKDDMHNKLSDVRDGIYRRFCACFCPYGCRFSFFGFIRPLRHPPRADRVKFPSLKYEKGASTLRSIRPSMLFDLETNLIVSGLLA